VKDFKTFILMITLPAKYPTKTGQYLTLVIPKSKPGTPAILFHYFSTGFSRILGGYHQTHRKRANRATDVNAKHNPATKY